MRISPPRSRGVRGTRGGTSHARAVRPARLAELCVGVCALFLHFVVGSHATRVRTRGPLNFVMSKEQNFGPRFVIPVAFDHDLEGKAPMITPRTELNPYNPRVVQMALEEQANEDILRHHGLTDQQRTPKFAVTQGPAEPYVPPKSRSVLLFPEKDEG